MGPMPMVHIMHLGGGAHGEGFAMLICLVSMSFWEYANKRENKNDSPKKVGHFLETFGRSFKHIDF